jgi:hypothetical protein
MFSNTVSLTLGNNKAITGMEGVGSKIINLKRWSTGAINFEISLKNLVY